jgi:predicted RNA-binding Zn-ribbon protein involved in translation (DUF1610 family)
MSQFDAQLRLLESLDDGQLDKLPCPKCAGATVTTCFTQPTSTEFKTWFVCRSCGFELRVQNVSRPRHFDATRIDPTLQRRDEELVRRRRFPPPD